MEAEIERLRSEIRQGDVEIEHRADQYSTLLHEIERLRNALLEMIEISKRNSEASLMLLAIRKCAQHALERK